MIATELARALRDSGLVWRPGSGDMFRIDGPEVDGDVFTISELTVEPQHFPTGTVLGFNGTTEWALDSVGIEDALWLPREDQLRTLLQSAFRSLHRLADAPAPATPSAATPASPDASATADDAATIAYRVDIAVEGGIRSFTGEDAADAYGRALLFLLDGLVVGAPDPLR
jgi:hypothetical protein